ncbi:unnamed protein product [Nippostrongylus brasiliensis]|uniref:SCP domain-containing protein n=1 Tax=Nippostrongylus brasiliensis TaxID=27835 RepID=A0A0N4XR16_NIPBR|nr:unnamed protein product [Nippostrongylus brasiliensis]
MHRNWLNTKDRPSPSTTGQRFGFKLIWTAVEGLYDYPHHMSSALSSTDDKNSAPSNTCSQFACQGGQICVEQVNIPDSILFCFVE